jgi:RTX calcium-binding nonapeptide repeat (4 copies)
MNKHVFGLRNLLVVGVLTIGLSQAQPEPAAAADASVTFILRDEEGELIPNGQLLVSITGPNPEMLYRADANGSFTISAPIGSGFYVRNGTSPGSPTFPLFTLDVSTTRTYIDRVGDAVKPTIIGTPGDDTITGTPGKDIIIALGGDDTIDGLGGDDIIIGGSGDDIVYGRGGNDRVFGGLGDDTLFGNSGDDELDGGSGDDVVTGGAGNDTLRGWFGSDLVKGGPGDDYLDEIVPGYTSVQFDMESFNQLNGGAGNDSFSFSRTTGRLAGGTGDDGFSFANVLTTDDVRVNCGLGTDTINFSDGSAPLSNQCEAIVGPLA